MPRIKPYDVASVFTAANVRSKILSIYDTAVNSEAFRTIMSEIEDFVQNFTLKSYEILYDSESDNPFIDRIYISSIINCLGVDLKVQEIFNGHLQSILKNKLIELTINEVIEVTSDYAVLNSITTEYLISQDMKRFLIINNKIFADKVAAIYNEISNTAEFTIKIQQYLLGELIFRFSEVLDGLHIPVNAEILKEAFETMQIKVIMEG